MTAPLSREDARREFHAARERLEAAVVACYAAADQCQAAWDGYFGVLVDDEFERLFAEIDEAAQ
jgi:hypothetical protein